MNDRPSSPGLTPSIEGGQQAPRLKPNTIGPWGLAALAIGITSPAIGLYALWGPMQALAGPISPLIFLAAMAMTIPTALSYAILNRHLPSTGSAMTWLWASVSPSLGYLAGLTMATYFVMATVAQPLMFALFFCDLLEWLRIDAAPMPALVVGVLIGSLPVLIVGLRGAEASIRTTVGLMIVESIVVVALSATILWAKGDVDAISLAPFDPREATNGIAGFWAAMILGVLAFCGFDVVSTAAEEANAPRAHLPKAIMLTVIGMTIFWAVNAWAFTLAVPHEDVLRYTEAGLTAITPLADRYWGAGSLIVILTAFTGIMAVSISCMQGASRLLFVLARQGLMPAPLAKLSGEAAVPRVAVVAVMGGTIAFDLLSLAILQDAMQAFLFWVNGLVFFAALTFAAVNLANVATFLRRGRQFNLLTNLIGPVIGIGVNLYLIYAAFLVNLADAASPSGRGMVVICLTVFAIQVGIVAWIRKRSPQLLVKEGVAGVLR